MSETLDIDLAPFFVLELTIYVPQEIFLTFDYGIGSRPIGAIAMEDSPIIVTDILRASDAGYVSQASDPEGVQSYRPVMTQSFAVNRRLALNPASDTLAAAWGTLTLSNVDGYYSEIAETDNCDGRAFSIYAGNKIFDESRGIWIDPPFSSLIKVIGGVGTPWFCDDTALQIPLRDPTYWLTQPLQAKLYAGTGKLEGGDGITTSLLNQPTLIGLPKPMTRGGTTSFPVRNITPVLVDAVNLIYQYNDGPGTVVALNVAGLPNAIAHQSDVPDLYVGTTTPGYYRTCNAKGIFQLGTGTSGSQMTANVTGAWPDGSAPTTGAAMALQMLLQDAVLPASLIDIAGFEAADAAAPFACGYFVSTAQTTGNEVLATLMNSIGASPFPKRDGTLSALLLRAIPPGSVPSASFDQTQIISCVAQNLGSPLNPPPFRWRVGVQKNWTVMTSGLNPTLTPLEIAYLGQAYATGSSAYAGGGWSNPSIQIAFTRPSDPDVVQSYLTNAADGNALAAELGALWSVPDGMSLYLVELPIAIGLTVELGDIVEITWPTRSLRNGAIGQIVGDQITQNVQNATISFLFLVPAS